MAKPGLDGHDRGAKTITRALRDHGFEVIYTGLHQTPEQIAETALQEDVDAVGLSLLSGAHLTLFPRVMDELRARDLGDVLVFGGGVIPDADARALREQGVAEIFGPGSSLKGIAAWLEDGARRARTTQSEPAQTSRATCRPTRRGNSGPVRVPGQAVLRPLRHPGVAGRRRLHRRRGRRRRPRRAGYPVVVKAQVQVGGRGKAGGIKLADNADEVRLHAGNILGHGHQGPRREAGLGRARQRHRQGVLRLVHARPCAPRSTC